MHSSEKGYFGKFRKSKPRENEKSNEKKEKEKERRPLALMFASS